MTDADDPPPDFYDPDADGKNDAWVSKLRKGRRSDAILSCPLCFTTVCVDCQQHAKIENQFRAMFVMHCKVNTTQIVRPASQVQHTRRKKKKKATVEEEERDVHHQEEDERYNPVACDVCDTELGLREVGPNGMYHLFHVIASTS